MGDFIKGLIKVKVNDIYIKTMINAFGSVFQRCHKVSDAGMLSAESMLIWVQKSSGFYMLSNVIVDQTFKNL